MAIGIIGLGIVGSRMAARLQAARYESVVHNRTREKAESLIAGGAQWGNVAKEIYALAAQHGLADADYSAVYKFLSEKA